MDGSKKAWDIAQAFNEYYDGKLRVSEDREAFRLKLGRLLVGDEGAQLTDRELLLVDEYIKIYGDT